MTPHNRFCAALSSFLLALFLLPFMTVPSSGSTVDRLIVASWYPTQPYQFQDTRRGGNEVTGLDIELAEEILRSAGYAVTFQASTWAQTQEDLKSGKIDMALGAFKTPQRETYALYSDPYRTETDAVFVALGSSFGEGVASFEELFTIARAQNKIFGVVEGFSYGVKVDALLATLDERHLLVFNSIESAIAALATGSIAGLIADQIVAHSAIAALEFEDNVSQLDLQVFQGAIHVMFSKATVDPKVVEAFNRAMREFKKDGRYQAILRENITPIHFTIALSGGWFTAMDIIGTIAFAISGVLLARNESYSLFGALVLAALPAVGGGVVRDLLTGREPIGILQGPSSLLLVVGTVVLGYLINLFLRKTQGQHPIADKFSHGLALFKRYVDPGNFFQVFDAIGMSAFTITGVYVAITMDAQPLWLWGPLLAICTAAGGGVIRDVVRADPNNPSLKTSFYAEIPLAWGLLLSLFIWFWGPTTPSNQIFIAVVITVLGAFLTRMAVVIWKVPSPRF